jgi:arsenite oxidase small subunit
VAASDDGEGQPREEPDPTSGSSRRGFLNATVAFAVVLVVGGVGSIAKALISPPASSSGSSASQLTNLTAFPTVKVANISDVKVSQPIYFNYPFQEQPNVLVKLGVKALNGVGPDGDIVAFSEICQHLGCIYSFQGTGSSPTCNGSYQAPGPVGYCCCHGSVFDFVNGGAVTDGPSPRPVPQVILQFDSSSGDISAVGMTPPTIFGWNTGSNDINADLIGGTPVS